MLSILQMLLGSIIGAGAMFAWGAYEGYKICNQTEEVRILTAQNKALTTSATDFKKNMAAFQAEADGYAKIVKQNNAVIADLQTKLATPNPTCPTWMLDSDFLRNLDRIK
jgi:predicted negative regulator of RcsB-dependent stress response